MWRTWCSAGERRTLVGSTKYGPHFDADRDPVAEAREEALDLLNYLYAIESERSELRRAIADCYRFLSDEVEGPEKAELSAQLEALLDDAGLMQWTLRYRP